jgi:hypothetical protein
MKQKVYIGLAILVLVIVIGIIAINLLKNLSISENSIKKEIFETGGAKAAFTCALVQKENYTITDNTLKISFRGNEDTFNFEKIEITNDARPSNNQNVSMKYHIYPDNKDSTFFAILYLGDDSELYQCYGGIAKPFEIE